MWADLLPHRGNDWRIILIDMPGHGGSASPPADAQLELLCCAWLKCSMQRTSTEPCCFFDGRAGGAVFALRHPERLDALVLMNGVFDRREECAQYRRPRRARSRGAAATSEAALDRWFTRHGAAGTRTWSIRFVSGSTAMTNRAMSSPIACSP
jgi:pimeloyl-ACP methyl ester carboxylesterase